MTRKLAYASSPGIGWPEDCWVRTRMWTQGISKAAAEAEIQAEIASKKLIVVEEEK